MASLETLGVGSLSLRGADSQYNKLSRFFSTKAEADASLLNGSWTPVEGVTNACITGDQGLMVYDFGATNLVPADSTIRPYIDAQISSVIAGAPTALDSLAELSAALGDNPAIITTLQTNLNDETTARTSADSGLDTRLIAAEGAISTLNTNVSNLQTADNILSDLGTFTGDIIADNSGLTVALQAIETALELRAPATDPVFTTSFRYEGTHIVLRDTVGGAGSDVILEISNKDFKIRNLQNAAVSICTQDVDRFTIGGDGNASFTGDVAVTGKVTTASGVFVQSHCSFDASSAGSFDFANDAIASHNIANVVRTAAGKFTVTFTNNFDSANYTVIGQAGDQDYSGVGASPRSVCILNRAASGFDIVVERTDDAANDDNGYVALMVMGTLA